MTEPLRMNPARHDVHAHHPADADERRHALFAVLIQLAKQGPIAVAVSGGVDSLTLMSFAHSVLQGSSDTMRVQGFHAVSPAVPRAATRRVEDMAKAEGWSLTLIDAGEAQDEEYLKNPVDRCRICKTHLYRAIRQTTARLPGTVVVSGTNSDDLSDYRPGLDAARMHDVRHPFVEARMNKEAVRSLARALGLHDAAELPAQPCLASRVETGTRIRPEMLVLIDDIEEGVRATLGQRATVRCRVRAQDIVVEIEPHVLAGLDAPARSDVMHGVTVALARRGLAHPVSLAPYRMGSAFLRVL